MLGLISLVPHSTLADGEEVTRGLDLIGYSVYRYPSNRIEEVSFFFLLCTMCASIVSSLS